MTLLSLRVPVCMQDEWVICRIFKKTGAEKKTSAFQSLDYIFDPSPSSPPPLAYPSLAEMQSMNNPPLGFRGKDKLHRGLPTPFHKSKEIIYIPEQTTSLLSSLVDANTQTNPFVVGTFPPLLSLQEAPAWLCAGSCPPESGTLGSCVLPVKTYQTVSNLWPNYGESLLQPDRPARSPETSSHAMRS